MHILGLTLLVTGHAAARTLCVGSLQAVNQFRLRGADSVQSDRTGLPELVLPID